MDVPAEAWSQSLCILAQGIVGLVSWSCILAQGMRIGFGRGWQSGSVGKDRIQALSVSGLVWR